MRHYKRVTKSRMLLATSPLEIKYTSKLEIVERLLLVQRQAQWKVPFPIDNEPDTTGTTGTTGITGTTGTTGTT